MTLVKIVEQIILEITHAEELGPFGMKKHFHYHRSWIPPPAIIYERLESVADTGTMMAHLSMRS